MKRDFDWQQLGEIPDPFSAASPTLAPAPSAELRAAMGASPTRDRRRAWRLGALLIAIVYEVVAVGAYGLRPDVSTLPAWQLAVGFLVPAVAASLALGAAVGSGRRGLGETPGRLRAFTLGAAVLFGVAMWLALPHVGDSAFWPHALGCMITTAVLGAVPVAFAAWVMRRSVVAAAAWHMAAMGVACGALAASAIALVCANEDASHVLVGHGTSMLVFGVLGAIAGTRFARA